MTWRRTLVVALAVAVAIGGGAATARKKKPRSALPPFDVTLVDPSSAVAGSGATVTVVATPTGKARKKKAILQRIDAGGGVLGTAARLRDDGRAPDVARRDGLLTGALTIDDAEPGLVLLRVKGTKKRPGSATVAVLVTRDLQPLADLFPSLIGADEPSHRLEPILEPLAGQLAAAAAQVLPPADDLLLTVTATPAAGVAGRPRPLVTTYKMGNATTNTAADTQVGKVLDDLAMLGVDVTSLRTTLAKTNFHQEGPQCGGFLLNTSRGVNGLTIVRSLKWNAKLETTDATNTAVAVVPANFSNHVILNAANMTSLLAGPNVDTQNKRLGSGASTALHELIHAMGSEEGCFDPFNDDDEPFVDAMEGIINLKVQIELDKKAGNPTTGSENDLTCRLAELWESQEKGRPCLMKLGFSVPTNVALAPNPGFVMFTAEVGGPASPASNTVVVQSTPPVCARAKIRNPRQFDMSIDVRKGVTPLTITVTASPTLPQDDGSIMNLPPGNYTNFIEIDSPSGAQGPIAVTVGLRVNAPGRAVRLGAAIGGQAQGAEVCLATIQGGCVNPAHEPICAYTHLHGPDGITITGVAGGPFADPASTGCGYGEVITKAGCGADTLPACH